MISSLVLVRVGACYAAMMLQNRTILEVCDEEPSKDSTAAATVGAQLGYGDAETVNRYIHMK